MNHSLLKVNLKRLKQTLAASSKIGRLPNGGLCRLALSNEDKAMRDLFVTWLKEEQLQVRVDDFGNIYGRRPGRNPDSSPVMIGSHLDTQPQGGQYDGVLGVLSALEVIRVLNEHNIETERPIEIVNFTNEEGARFEPPMLGSGGLANIFDEQYVFNREDRQGRRFKDELARIGYAGKKENRAKQIYCFIELHVEQGSVLHREQVSIGAVEGIQGMTWLEVRVTGEADHAGPTPMSMRKDALVAAAKMITAIEQVADEVGSGVTTTVGRLAVEPNVVNCVPGQVVFSVDIRHFDDATRRQTVHLVQEKISTIAVMAGVDIEINNLWETESTHFAQEIVDLVMQGAEQYGYSARRIVSGAGHDAKYINAIAPAGMIFVPSINGKSHCPEELTLMEDIEKGANVLLYVTHQLAQHRGD
ncbi:Zn-dependent hydrolase [Caldalkalibacillus thermarum]|uniref:Zn-dependent hydrolase n=1 Tax=Caldalkalibacillus thermarum TaxID=296745 RepID=UPI0016654EDE|nr:Zn-dependent hydrolase [Caldalkalibacillus thermarum]